jgi:DNA-binding MurR/RpiR family transcriptional regulator
LLTVLGTGDSVVQHESEASIALRLHGSLPQLPRGERLVALALINDFPMAGLGSLAELAQRAGVSEATVLRLLARMGFDGYSDFKHALHLELSNRTRAALLNDHVEADQDVESPEATISRVASTVAETARSFQSTEFERAVALLANPQVRVHTIGGFYTQSVAWYLRLHLGAVRPHVDFLPYGSADLAECLASAGRRDVVVAFDFRRYSTSTVAACQHVKARGGKVVLVTDEWLSPAVQTAEAVLVARTESVKGFDSLAGVVALADALRAGVSKANDSMAADHLDALESLRETIGQVRRDGTQREDV